MHTLRIAAFAVCSICLSLSCKSQVMAQTNRLIITSQPAQVSPYVAGNQSAVRGVSRDRLVNQAQSIANAARRQNDPCSVGRDRFVESALWFDTNRDQSLAVHELQNLMYTVGQQQAFRLSGNRQLDAQVVNEQTYQFVTVFTTIAMQHDTDQNSMLNQQELTRFADQLIQFDPSLAGQACQQSRARAQTRAPGRVGFFVNRQTQQPVQFFQSQQPLSNLASQSGYQGFNLNPSQSCPSSAYSQPTPQPLTGFRSQSAPTNGSTQGAQSTVAPINLAPATVSGGGASQQTVPNSLQPIR